MQTLLSCFQHTQTCSGLNKTERALVKQQAPRLLPLKMSGAPGTVQVAKEVQEVIAICLLGIVVYIIMVGCILCRRQPSLAEGFEFDADPESYIGRRPEDPDGYYFGQSEPRVINKAAEGHLGRVIIDRGTAQFRGSNGKKICLDRLNYGVFDVEESFEIMEASDEMLFHLDLYDRRLDAKKQT